MVRKVLLTLLVTALVAVGGQSLVHAAGLYEGYALADGTITDIQPWSMAADIKDFCKISYDVTIDGKSYSEKNTYDTHDFCHLEIGDTIKISYLKSDPRKHKVATEFQVKDMNETKETTSIIPSGAGLLFLIPFGVVFLLILSIVIFVIIPTMRTARKRLSDTDGDGLTGDDKPATAEQKKLVEEGFRKLGVYHDVKKKMTRAQARETLREIDNQLKKK